MEDINEERDLFKYQNHDAHISADIEIYEVAAPEANKILIFICGFGDPFQNHLDIHSVVAATGGFRVIGINLPGHGRSEQIHNVSWELLVDIVREFVLKEEIKEFYIGGFSMGGGVALKYASMYPEGIKGVKLLSPLCYDLPSIGKLIKGGLKFSINFLKNGFQNPSKKEKPIGKIYPLYYLEHFKSVLSGYNFNKELLLKQEHLPIDVIIGKDDEIIDVELIKQTLEGIPDVKIHIGEGFGHDIYYKEEELLQKIGRDIGLGVIQ